MAKIIVTIPMTEEEKQIIKETVGNDEVVYLKNNELIEKELNDCEIVIGNIAPELLKGSNVKWVHLNSAGVNNYIDVISEKMILTNSNGAYGIALAEHALTLIFALKKKLHYYIKNQEKALWNDEGEVTSIFNSKTLIVGLGDIGKEVGKRLKALGSSVYGIKRDLSVIPEYVDGVYSLDKIDTILPDFDIVILALPETSETKNLFTLEKFQKMKKSSILINVGRGTSVLSEDLYVALEEGMISGAGLDVTDIEPLPSSHKLWKAKNLILTPHVAGGYHLDITLEKIKKIAIENLKAYYSKKELKNIIDIKKGY